VLDADAEVEFDDIALPVGQGAEGALDLAAQRFAVFQFLVGAGVPMFSSTSSRELSSPSTKGASIETWRAATPRVVSTSSVGISSISASSSALGSRSYSCSNSENALLILLREPTLLSGQAHDARLFGQGLQDRLANPPHGVGDEFEAAGFVEALGGFDQAQVAFVDEVAERKALILVLFGYRNDESEVGFCQFFQGGLIALV
jgi:hypothetical protein